MPTPLHAEVLPCLVSSPIAASAAAPWVVLLHPTPVDHRFWYPAAAALRSGYRVLLPDLPGHGLSMLDLQEPLSIASMARAVIGLLDHQGIEEALFAGCSLGGYVLYELSRQAPKRMRGLAFVCAKPHADNAEARARRDQTIDALEREGAGKVFAAQLKTLVGEPAQQADPTILSQLGSMAGSMTAAAAIAVQRALGSRPDSRDSARAISVPTAAMAGALDPGSTPADMRELAGLVPGASFYLLREMGHYAPFEQPPLVGALLRHFFDECAGDAHA